MFEYLKNYYVNNGSFVLRQGQDINRVVSGSNVPNDFGVYLISKACDGELIYVGKAGSVSTDGTLKKQGIRGRLVNERSGTSSSNFFREYMGTNKCDLQFDWFTTFDDSIRVLPALAEAKLIQEYFDKCGRLPSLNKSF